MMNGNNQPEATQNLRTREGMAAPAVESGNGNARAYSPPRIVTHSAEALEEQATQAIACTSFPDL